MPDSNLPTDLTTVDPDDQAELPAVDPEAEISAVDPLDGVWDVVVVGAGPAGASAAHAAAAQGRRVLLLDKAEHPRYKTCGGGIIGPSRDSLPPDFKIPLQDRVHAVTFALNGRFTRTRRSRRMLFGLVNRGEFDLRLVEAAQQAGAVLVSGVTVTGVEQQGGADRRTVAVTLADGRAVQARAVVGADGSASRIGRHVGVTFDQIDLGLEAEIPVPERVVRAWEGRIHLDWGPLPGSYGWVFPKTDSGTLTVGVISARGDGELTKRYLADYIRRLGLAGFTPAVESGHLTRCRAEDSPLSRGRVLVAGDAAGLLEPWTREGISYALRSGRLAGEWAVQVAEAGNPTEVRRQALNYAFAVKAGLGVEMRAGKVMLEAFERRPHLFHLAVCVINPAWRAFAQTTQGHTTFGQILRQYRAARRLAALASR
ncbi:geranylgeranyl reductase family protein [Kitasatospora kifunensis]|uniref:Geranylgeranyl reductase family protein n=1 Tax=Kitasatospora kifunensis TaxID=58351 RepID=A0A7W7VT40_KITKI|nr:geranylgeranyl reductase family protein [Kitasatospora kifunensis]